MNRYEEVEKIGNKARGRIELLNHLNGKQLTAQQAIRAKCYDCTGYYADGREDCKITTCSLYSFMPYSSNPRIKKQVSELQRETARKRFKDFRQTKSGV